MNPLQPTRRMRVGFDGSSQPEEKIPKHTHKPRRALGDITNAAQQHSPKTHKEKKKPHLEVLSEPDVEPMSLGEKECDEGAHDEAEEIDLEDEFGAEAHQERMLTMPDLSERDSERSYMHREVDEIDQRDAHLPEMAVTYVNELYEVLKQDEIIFQVEAEYMSHQEHINPKMRAILVDWLVDVHTKFRMHSETLFLTVWIIDHFLQSNSVKRSKLQLVGVASLLLAAKYEEMFPPECRELVTLTDRAYTIQEILEMEETICKALEFRFTAPTVHSFICRYVKAAHADTKMIQIACYLAERCLKEYSMLVFRPSVIAASTLRIARKTMNRNPWSPTLLHYTQYDEDDLQECVDAIQELLVAQSVPAVCLYTHLLNIMFHFRRRR